MEQNEKKRTLKPYHGIILFVLVLVFLIFGATPIQMSLGMGGVALTEIILLVMALIPAIVLKADLKEMFPIKKPKIRQIAGVILLWFGTFLLGTLVTLIIGFFFPDGMAEVGIAMNDIFTSIPMLLAYLIIAVMPAICEEALHRGFILTTMKPIRREWVIVLVMGLIFGLFHLDPYRFAATAILGMALTYVMLKTKNILMPALFHLINNSLSVIVSFATAQSSGTLDQAGTSAALSSTLSIGSYLILGSIIPFLILGGVVLLRSKIEKVDQTAAEVQTEAQNEVQNASQSEAAGANLAIYQAAIKRRRKSTMWSLIVSGILAVVMFLSGAAIVAGSMLAAPVLDHSETVTLNNTTESIVLPFEVVIPKSYILTYDMSTQRGLIELVITDASGKDIYDFSAADIYGSAPVTLAAGSYKVTLTFIQSDIEAYYKEHYIEYNKDDLAALDTGGDLTVNKSADIKLSIR